MVGMYVVTTPQSYMEMVYDTNGVEALTRLRYKVSTLDTAIYGLCV